MRSTRGNALALAAACILSTASRLPAQAEEEDSARLSDQVVPPAVDLVPGRPWPRLELGDPFLGTGILSPGYELPTGQVLRPSFLVFGTYRTATQAWDDGDVSHSEWANRLDLFGNLQLSGTERILIGFRPLDDDGDFSGYVFEPDAREGSVNEFNGKISTLFFEGDFGEIFPGLDPDDTSTYDWGFSVGRQPILIQDGLLIDDDIDSVGIVRNSLAPAGTSNLRLTGLWGFNDIERNDNQEDRSTQLFGLFSEADLTPSTLSFDAIYVHDADDLTDAFYAGVGSVQRIGHFNTTLRAAASFPVHDDTPEVSGGGLLFAEISRSPESERVLAHDHAYANAFWGIDEFSSAARGPDRGGPLGRLGVLYQAVGLGGFPAALGNRPDSSVGGAIGYQMFSDDTRRQLILEVGGRSDTDGSDTAAIATGARFQQAFGQHTIFRLDGFITGREHQSAQAGLRLELVLKF